MDIRISEAQPAGDVHPEFDRVASAVGPLGLAHGLAKAFRSDQTPPFSHMVSRSFGQSSGQQKAGLLNSLLSITPASLVTEVLATVHGNRQVTPEEAERIPPGAVQQLAERAEQRDGSVVDRISEFYAQHPGVVKTLGVGALMVLTDKIVKGIRGRSGA